MVTEKVGEGRSGWEENLWRRSPHLEFCNLNKKIEEPLLGVQLEGSRGWDRAGHARV